MYRAMLVDLSTNHSRRRAMGEAAARDAATRSWHGAMEMLVDGYREISLPVPPPAPATPLSLSRTSTIELDIVCDSANADSYAESTAAAVKRGQSGKLLRLGGVFRRTGGRFKEGSMSIKPLRSWLAKGVESSTEVVEGIPGDHMSYAVFTKPRSSPVWATREFERFVSTARSQWLTPTLVQQVGSSNLPFSRTSSTSSLPGFSRLTRSAQSSHEPPFDCLASVLHLSSFTLPL